MKGGEDGRKEEGRKETEGFNGGNINLITSCAASVYLARAAGSW